VADSEAVGSAARGADGVLEAVNFKKATESMGKGTVANARWK